MLVHYGVRNVNEMRRVAKDRCTQHYAEIRAAVPKERLLKFRLEDGWEPLCEFLDKEIPGVPFPTKNKRGEHMQRVRQKQNMFFKHVAIRFAKKKLSCSVVVGVMVLLVWKSTSCTQWLALLELLKKTLSERW